MVIIPFVQLASVARICILFPFIARLQASIGIGTVFCHKTKHEKKSLYIFLFRVCVVIGGMFDSKLVNKKFVSVKRNENK